MRPWLTVIMDDYSRAIAGFSVNVEAPSTIQTALTLRHAMWRKSIPNWKIIGIPATFYSDHGSDFTSAHLAQVSADLHMALVFSEPGMPRGRGKIERFFRTVNQMLLCALPGYTPAGMPPTMRFYPCRPLKPSFSSLFWSSIINTRTVKPVKRRRRMGRQWLSSPAAEPRTARSLAVDCGHKSQSPPGRDSFPGLALSRSPWQPMWASPSSFVMTPEIWRNPHLSSSALSVPSHAPEWREKPFPCVTSCALGTVGDGVHHTLHARAHR